MLEGGGLGLEGIGKGGDLVAGKGDEGGNMKGIGGD